MDANDENIQQLMILGDFITRHGIWSDHSQNEHGQVRSKFCSQSQIDVLNMAQPTFVCIKEDWSIIDLGICNQSLNSKLKDSFVDSAALLFTGAPNRGHCPVWIAFEMNAKEKDVTRKRLDWKNTVWSVWSKQTEQKFEASSDELEKAPDAIKHG